MKIAFLCNSPSWGGLEMNTANLGGWLRERGHQVSLIAHADYQICQQATQRGLDVIPFKAKYDKISLPAVFSLARKLKALRPNALIITMSNQVHIGALLKNYGLGKTKLIFQQHMEVGIDKRDLLHTWMYRRLDAWVTPLQSLKQQVLQRTNMRTTKVHVIPVCLNMSPFAEVSISKETARQALSLPEGLFLLGMMGRIDPHKGHLYFLEALAELREKDQAIGGVIVGLREEDKGTAYFQELEAKTTALGLGEHLFFRPFSEEIATAYAAMDVFVMASPAETFGMVTVEALAAGLPVIGVNRLGTKEILQNGRYGLTVKPKSGKAIAHAVTELLEDPILGSILSEKGKKYAFNTFPHHRQCEMFENLISQLEKES